MSHYVGQAHLSYELELRRHQQALESANSRPEEVGDDVNLKAESSSQLQIDRLKWKSPTETVLLLNM